MGGDHDVVAEFCALERRVLAWPPMPHDPELDLLVYSAQANVRDPRLRCAAEHLFARHSLSFALRPMVSMLVNHVDAQVARASSSSTRSEDAGRLSE